MGTFTDPRDGEIYKTIVIGNQIWMAENLKFKAEGSKCYGEGGPVLICDGNKQDYITLSNDKIQDNYNKYGRLYDWNTAMKVCPAGWHLPCKEEWQELVEFAGGDKIAGGKLKAISGWYSNGNGTDDYGFAALPGGYSLTGDKFEDVEKYGYWWSSTEHEVTQVYFRRMYYGDVDVERYIDIRSRLYSVRCVQD